MSFCDIRRVFSDRITYFHAAKVFGVQLFKDNAQVLLLHTLSIVNTDWENFIFFLAKIMKNQPFLAKI